jgi:tyrosyl-tRNA synthetase
MTKHDILDELTWRGLIHQNTDIDGIRKLLSAPSSVYVGFDPTSDSLHVGSLLPLTVLRRFQKAGHRPMALVGGATGMVGDPSGKSDERNLLDRETLAKNVAGIEAQMKRFLDFDGPNAAILINNFDWMKDFTYLDFLRDVGKNFPVNVMLSKDSVKTRLESDSGLSYTEFSYMLLQAYDFAYLAKNHECRLQVGGSDQWGNITAGIDLARRMFGQQLFGMTCPLLLTSDGRKMGKTERGAIYLSADRTSPYAFYQYFLNVADDDVLMVLRFLSDVTVEKYAELETGLREKPHERAAQKYLAESLTKLVHGEAGWQSALQATQVLFGAEIENLDDRALLAIFEDVPSQSLSLNVLHGQGYSIVEAVIAAGLANSKSEARRAIDGGGIYLNNRRVEGSDRMLTEEDRASESVMVLRSGRKKYGLLRFEPS